MEFEFWDVELCCFTAQGEKLIGGLVCGEIYYQLMHHSPLSLPVVACVYTDEPAEKCLSPPTVSL